MLYVADLLRDNDPAQVIDSGRLEIYAIIKIGEVLEDKTADLLNAMGFEVLYSIVLI